MPLVPFRTLYKSILKETRRKNGRVFLADGAMGTELMRQGVEPCDILKANVSNPQMVFDLHKSYIDAGADIITTNTFGMWDPKSLGRDNLAILMGIEIALEAAGESERDISVWVSLSGDCAEKVLKDSVFRWSYRGDVGLLIETCMNATQSSRAHRVLEDAPIHRNKFFPQVSSYYFQSDGRLPDGSTVEDVSGDRLASNGHSHIVGANCGDTPESFVEITSGLRRSTRRPILVQPNAGLPEIEYDGKLVHPLSIAEYVDLCMRIVEAGANIVGGCCGVTPDHIASLRRELQLR